MIGNAYSKSPLSSSRLTEIRKNRMLYADYISKTQGNNQGCDTARTGLETGHVASGSIVPQLLDGATNTTVQEQASILQNTDCEGPIESGTILFTNIGTARWTAPSRIFQVQYLVVGGGGGSGGGYDTGAGAGGGGGMVLIGTYDVIPGTTYTVVVGDGGANGISIRTELPEIPGQDGNDSVFATVTARGGGGGWPSRQPSGSVNGNGGTAAVNPTSVSLGGNGGGANGGGGGGGGSSGAGGNKSGVTAGAGGAGTASSLSGSSVIYGTGGAGGTGNTNNAGVAGLANTGNGAKGGGAISGADENGAKGGSGIVILKY